MEKKIKIAIADDHQLIRAGMSMILRENINFQIVQEAANGQELIDRINSTKPDVVLLDLEMPVLSGKETLIALRKISPDIKVLVLTMHNNQAFIIQMMELGANGYLIKDTDPKEVIHAINKVMQSGYYFSDQVSIAMLHGISEPKIKTEHKLPDHGLTKREIDILRLICQEKTTIEIGQELFLSPKTIEGYRKILMDKTDSRNMAGLVLFAIKNALYNDGIR